MNYIKQEKNSLIINRQQVYEIISEGEGDTKLVVRRLLTLLGFKSKLLGTQYLQDAILYRYANLGTMYAGMTNRAYIAVADKWNSTSTRVERAIRNSIVNCYIHGALKSFNDLSQAPIIDTEFAPSNGEFMCSVVNWLQLEMQSDQEK